MDPNSMLSKMTPKLCQLTDRFGHTFYYGNAGDFWHAPFPIGADTDYRTITRQIKAMEVRDDDIFICSYPKSGTHWHDDIIHMLVAKSAEYFKGRMEHLGFSEFAVHDKLPSPRIFCIHYPFRHMPKQLWEKNTKAKVIRLVRNPKDVFVSFYNHIHGNTTHLGYAGTFEEFVTLCLECGFYFGDLFDYMMEWQDGEEANPQIFTSVYEDMKKDSVGVIKRLNDYLGTGCSQQLCEDIARACEFSKLKAAKDAVKPEITKAQFKDPSTSFYRKGVVGDWENWFTPSLLKLYEEEYEKRMSNYKIKFS